MMSTPDDARKEIEAELETLVALGLVSVSGVTDDGEWLYTLTDEAREMVRNEEWDVVLWSWGADGTNNNDN